MVFRFHRLSFHQSLTHHLYPSCHLQPWAMTPVRIFDHLWPFLTCTCMSVLGINGVGGVFCNTLLHFFETFIVSCEWVFFNVTYYYTSSKLTMYHYKWLKLVYFKHIKHVSSWRKHNVLFYSYAIILPRNLSLQKIT